MMILMGKCPEKKNKKQMYTLERDYSKSRTGERKELDRADMGME